MLLVLIVVVLGAWPVSGSASGVGGTTGKSTNEAIGQASVDDFGENANPPLRNRTAEEIAGRCNECHGERGQSETPEIPSIGGFTAFAIMELFETYRMGLRAPRTVTLSDGTETDMEEVINALSEDDEWAVAEYYSRQPWRPHEQTFDAELAARGALVHEERCDKCHHDGGRDPEFDLPISAGQWREYLVAEFDNFDSGRRAMSQKMKKKYDTLSAADKQAIIELYVSAGNY